MPKRGENIRKRKDGRWEGRYKTGNAENGRTLYRSIYGKSYTEVKAKLRGVITTAAKSKKADRQFSDILRLWLACVRISVKEATFYRYEYIAERHICPELGKMHVAEISAPLINTFLDRKLKSGRLDGGGGLSPAYVKSIMLVILAALDFASCEKYCEPLSGKINKPNGKKEEISILTEESQQKLEQYIQFNTDITALGVMTSLYAGLRIGEICALAWEDIDFANQIIHVRHTIARVKPNEKDSTAKSKWVIDEPKTKSSKRDIPIASILMPFLSLLQSRSKSKYVVSETDDFISPRTYEYRFHQILKKSGVDDINYHALRHTFATRCVAVGVDIKSLSEMLGHSNVAITLNTYVHSSMSTKRIQLEKLSAAYTA